VALQNRSVRVVSEDYSSRLSYLLIDIMRANVTLLALLFLTVPVLAQKQQNQADDDSTTSFLSHVTIPKGSSGEDVVCILCSAEVQGRLTGDLVLIGGNAEITGSVDGDVVVVGGWILTRGDIGGEAFALGGSITRDAGAQIKGESESFPWFHLPGQRSFHAAGVLCLIGFLLLLVFFAGLLWKRERSERLADRLTRRWWLALLVGGAVWFGYFEYLDEIETGSEVLGILLLILVLVLLIATWFGFYGMAWAVGRRVSQAVGWKTRLAGALILAVALLVPVLGLAILCLIFTIGLGAGLLFTWPAVRTAKPVAIEASAQEIP